MASCSGVGGTVVPPAPPLKLTLGLLFNDDGLAVDVGDGDIRDVVDCSVVEESVVAPIAAFVADAIVAETVNNAAIKADVWSPIALVKNVVTIVPAPISGRPQ